MKRVVVEGGGENLYRVRESPSGYSVYHVDEVRLLGDKETSIGKTDSIEDAYSLIRSDSGENIKEITNRR